MLQSRLLVSSCTGSVFVWLLKTITYSLTNLLTYAHTQLLTCVLTSWSRVLLEKLTGCQLTKKFLPFYGTRTFITAFTSAHHVFLSGVSSIQSIPPHPTFWRSVFPYTPGSPKWSLSLRFPHQNPVYAFLLPHTRHMLNPSHSSRFYHPNSIGWEVKGKGKAVPLQAWSSPEGSRKLRFPVFMQTAQDGGRLSALRTGRPYPPGNTPGTHFCKRLSRPQGHSAIGRILCHWHQLGSNRRWVSSTDH